MAPVDFGSGVPDLGILVQSTDDDQDWKIINKKTPTVVTGPTADHSTGTGYYGYLETSGIAIGSRVCFCFCLKQDMILQLSNQYVHECITITVTSSIKIGLPYNF